MAAPPGTAHSAPRMSFRTGLALLAFCVGVQTAYATWLNWFLYREFSPFFDSMVYAISYADILSLSREGGILQGLHAALYEGTAPLPWIFTALLSPVLPYSRFAGIWFQELWMLALAGSVYFYLTRCRATAPARALCFTLPFLAFRVVFAPNGGISDFRMDLLLYLLLANMAVWYLATYEWDSWKPWAASGVFLLLAILGRATAPAYAVVMFAPLLAARLLAADRHGALRLLVRLLAAWLPAALLGCWPLLAKYRYLAAYYSSAGSDAAANLPLWKAMMHVAFAGWHIGVPLTLVAVTALLAGLRERRALCPSRRALLRAMDWRPLWLGSAPVVLLVLLGAGPNIFVSMPAVFGWLLFALLPFRGPLPDTPRQGRLALLLAAACALNALYGIKLHAFPAGAAPGMKAVRAAIDRMQADAQARRTPGAAFATAHIADLQETTIRNVLVFEYGAAPRDGTYTYGGVTFRAPEPGPFGESHASEWRAAVPGRDDAERVQNLVRLALREVDYFFLPDEPSLAWIEENRPFNFINTKTREFKRLLLATGRWELLGDPLVVSPHETILLYRQRR